MCKCLLYSNSCKTNSIKVFVNVIEQYLQKQKVPKCYTAIPAKQTGPKCLLYSNTCKTNRTKVFVIQQYLQNKQDQSVCYTAIPAKTNRTKVFVIQQYLQKQTGPKCLLYSNTCKNKQYQSVCYTAVQCYTVFVISFIVHHLN